MKSQQELTEALNRIKAEMKDLNSGIVDIIDEQRTIIAGCRSDEEFLTNEEFRRLSQQKAELGKKYSELGSRKDELEHELDAFDQAD